MLDSLEEFKQSSTDSAIKSSGLLNFFRRGCTLLFLKIALKVFQPLEELNRSLQSQSSTVSGMLTAAHNVLLEMQRL